MKLIILFLFLFSIPPLPPIIPDVSPVVNIKRKTIQRFYLSDEAAKLLFNTPVHYYHVLKNNETSISPFVGKFYERRLVYNYFFKTKYQEIIIVCCNKPDVETVLMHEFAHKWYFILDSNKKREWNLINELYLNQYTVSRINRDFNYHEFRYYEELYAVYAENGPLNMDNNLRKYFYNGLFDEERIYKIQKLLKEIK